MQVELTYPLADEILKQFKTVIGKDYDGYRNHVIRMLNFCHYLLAKDGKVSEQDSQKLQIAAAFHDIALWTDNRVDYLVPSYQQCDKYLQQHGLMEWQQELQIIIDCHHLLSQYRGPYERLVEVFRKADLVDFSCGLVKNGVDGQFVKAVRKALPNAGFHQCLMRFSWLQLTRAPLNPMPMLRIKNIYKA